MPGDTVECVQCGDVRLIFFRAIVMNSGRVSDTRDLRPSPKVSVIVPVFNGLPYLQTQLDRLLSQQCDFSWEVLYVDNGSKDQSREVITQHIVERSDVQVRMIDGSQQRGQVHARNVGAAAARADLL